MLNVIISIVFMVVFLWSWKQVETAEDNCRNLLYAIMVISGFGCLLWVLTLGGIL